MKVPLLDLRGQFATIREEVRLALDEVLESQVFINGPQVATLEAGLAAYCHTSHAVAVSSGSDALLASLLALGLRPGDEVVTTPFTFFATAGAIVRVGATPVFADIDPSTFNLDPQQTVARITSATRVLLPVHLYGQLTNMPLLVSAAHANGIAIVEDAAQAIGANDDRGQRAGSFGVLGCFSFFPSKNLGAFGDAGLITTSDAALAERLRVLRAHGSSPKYYHKIVGGNFRMDTLQAAVLAVKLNHLERWTSARHHCAIRYATLFRQAALAAPDSGATPSRDTPIVLPPDPSGGRHTYHQFTVRALSRDPLQHFLRTQDIDTAVYYPVPLHLQECFRHLGHRVGAFPEAERASQEVLSLPIYPEVSPSQQEYVVDRIAAFYRADAT